jgi:hypothetical protein
LNGAGSPCNWWKIDIEKSKIHLDKHPKTGLNIKKRNVSLILEKRAKAIPSCKVGANTGQIVYNAKKIWCGKTTLT